MKNLLVGAFSMFLIVGCQKQEVAPSVGAELSTLESLKQNVSVNNEMLVFSDEQSYSAAIDYLMDLEANDKEYASYWDHEIGFNSLNQQKTEKELDKMGIYDAVFAELLNAKQEVQIGAQIFRINTVDGTMTVEDIASKEVEIFSTNDSYFDIKEGLSVKGAKAGCPKRKAESTRWGAGSSGQISSKVTYQRGGIYFSLQSKIQQSSRPNGRTISLNAGTGNTYTKNKNGASQVTIGTNSQNGTNGSYNYRPYFNTRQLKQFYFRVSFAYNHPGVGSDSWISYISCS